jgi:hypothetical protein
MEWVLEDDGVGVVFVTGVVVPVAVVEAVVVVVAAAAVAVVMVVVAAMVVCWVERTKGAGDFMVGDLSLAGVEGDDWVPDPDATASVINAVPDAPAESDRVLGDPILGDELMVVRVGDAKKKELPKRRAS